VSRSVADVRQNSGSGRLVVGEEVAGGLPMVSLGRLSKLASAVVEEAWKDRIEIDFEAAEESWETFCRDARSRKLERCRNLSVLASM
jgi:hypothetical protein